jgi:hypothetical protein
VASQFREVEAALGTLKEKFSQGKISQREFIDSLKALRIRDDEGRFWMIGAQSGKWYYFEGDDWVQAKPPSFGDRKAVCIYCGYENELEAETCVRCGGQKSAAGEGRVCPQCGTKLEGPGSPCPVCETDIGTAAAGADAAPDESGLEPAGTHLVIKAVQPSSFFWFSGALGLFAGIILGLLVGVTNFFPRIVSGLPGFFVDIQGKLLGGIVFTVLGGLTGFALAGAAGFVAANLSNWVLSLVGGVRIDVARAPGRREDKDRN